jgi:asparagine synthase (glutamine-hydrolysing)
MNGIAGIVSLDGDPVGPGPCVQRLLDRISHRGTGESGVWSDGVAMLGQTGSRPTSSGAGRIARNPESGTVAVGDVRLDNRAELAVDLGCTLPAVPELELIVRAFDRWQDDCCRRLLGDFAFAVWQPRQKRLLCARDQLGVRPFFHARVGRCLVFASEAKVLFAMPGCPRAINDQLFAEDFADIGEDPTATYWSGIERLPAGSLLTLACESGAARRRQYWRLPPPPSVPGDASPATFRALLSVAVADRLGGDGRPGCELSGGLDSAAVTALAQQHQSEPLPAWTIAFDDANADELAYARALTSHCGVDLSVIPAAELAAPGVVETIVRCQDEPVCPLTLLIAHATYSRAAASGVERLLDGIDGDSTVGHGLAHLHTLLRRGSWLQLAHEIQALSCRFRRPRRWFLRQYVVDPLVPQSVARQWRRLKARGTPGAAEYWLDPMLIEATDLAGRSLAFADAHRADQRDDRTSHRTRLHSRLLPDALEMRDRLAACCGVDVLHPLCDLRLVEFCARLPPTARLTNGWTRMIMREALVTDLPPAVCWRGDKARLSANLAHAVVSAHREQLHDASLLAAAAGRLNVTAIRALTNRYAAMRRDADALALADLLPALLWLRAAAS